jgi:NADH-quinone oxidoreductase subunit E
MALIGNAKYTERIERHLAKYPDKRSAVMPLLYIAQEEYGYVNEAGIAEVASLCDMDPTQVKSIAGFYTMYSEKPKGKYWLQVCTDLACALRGADELHHELLHELGIEEGGTTADGLFTAEHVMCLAACDKAPMLQCNFHFVEAPGGLTMNHLRELIAKARSEGLEDAQLQALLAQWRKAAEEYANNS